jgi:predicted metal-binding membrane protein
MSAGIAEAVLKRDRTVVLIGLASIFALSWVYMFYLAWNMSNMDIAMEMAMPNMQIWGLADFFFTFIMWAVMMVAMMTPSAAPMVLMFSKFNRQHHEQQTPFMDTGIFILGYLIVWTGFSAVATVAQWGLHSLALLSPMMSSTSPIFGGLLLIGAGIFQFTPLKHACLAHCRTPLGFFMTEWREGKQGALVMGLRHGNFCVGCCWFLMALLFVAGVMNLLWVAAIAVYVLIEKVVPKGHWVSRAIGLLVIVWGLWMIIGSLLNQQVRAMI